MTTISDLPHPSATALKRSKALTEYIRQVMNNHSGLLSFDHFMAFALYHPEFGYYNAPEFTLGKNGDFTTAPEISPLFAKCLARQCAQILPLLPVKNVLEIGAGLGTLACGLLQALAQTDCLPEHYYIVETSLNLRAKQRAFLQTQLPDLFARVRWLDAIPAEFIGVIIANEVADALPVHCFQIENETVMERCVSFREEEFIWQNAAPLTPALAERVAVLQRAYELSDGYASEYSLRLDQFIRAAATALKTGVLLLLDYGYGQREYYRAERRQGTLACFYQHRLHHDPLLWPGLQDITAHVDFTRVIELADACGCELLGYTTQAAFLLACGLLVFAAQEELILSAAEQVNFHQQIKLLTLPMEMGERVKVMAVGKGVTESLLGFELQDRTREL